MTFGDGWRSGKLSVKRVGDFEERQEDPKSRPSEKERAILPSGLEARVALGSAGFCYAIVAEPKKGKESDNTTPERVHWIHGGKLVSTKETMKLVSPLHPDPVNGRVLFMADKDLIEADLKTGDTKKIPYKNWPPKKKAPNNVVYLSDDSVLMAAGFVAFGKRTKDSVELSASLDINSTWTSLDQRVLFSSSDDAVILGYERGQFRVLAKLGVSTSSPWLIAKDKLRFYVDPFQNEDLPPESCGAFELSGALDAWKDCFASKDIKKYPEVKQTALKKK